MRKNNLFKRTLAIALAGVLAFGNLSTAEAATAEAEVETQQDEDATKPEDIIYEEGKLVDGSVTWNSQGGGAIEIKDGYYTNVYFVNEPFIRGDENWFNFVVETTKPDDMKGYTLRADNFGWAYPNDENDPNYNQPAPTMTSQCSDWNWDWGKFKEFCAGNVIVSAYKYNATTLKFYIQYSKGDTLAYTLVFPNPIPSDLKFFVGSDGGKVTQNKITFTETMPNSIDSIAFDKQTAELTNEFFYASEEDKEQDKKAMSTYGSVNLSAALFPAEGEKLYFKDFDWKVSDADKAEITDNGDGTAKVTLKDAAMDNDKIVVTASAVDGSKAQAQCEITAKVQKTVETTKVTGVKVEDQTVLLGYDKSGAPLGKSVTVVPIVSPDDAEIRDVTLSTDSDKVKINGNTITAVKEGEAIVKVTSKSSSKVSSDFKVTVRQGNFGELTSEFTAAAFASAESGYEKLTGDFDIIYHFKNKSAGTNNWDNFIFELTDGNNNFTTLRADAFGWGSLHDRQGESDNIDWTKTENMNGFAAEMKDAAVTVCASRHENKIEVKYHIVGKTGKVYDIMGTCSKAAGFPEVLYVHLTGEKVAVTDITISDNSADAEKFDIPVTKDTTYAYKSEEVFKNVKVGSSVTFGVTPITGYSIKVSYGEVILTADEEGNYTIPFVTDKDTELTVEAEADKYPITYIVDGVAQEEKGEFSITDVVDGKVALKAAGTIDGWFATEDDKTTKITEFTAADYMTEDGITVYGYMPYQITLIPADLSSLTNGTIEPFDTTKSYYKGDAVSITTVPNEGYTANITVSYKDANGEDQEVETTKVSENGKEVISFTMPAANVTITCAEFTGIDKSELEAAITAAKTIYDAGNSEGVYTAESYSEFKAAYEAAIAARTATTQTAVNTAKDNLIEAQGDLVFAYKVTLSEKTMTIEAGKTGTLTATVTTQAEDKSVVWKSSNETVATVAGGVVTAVAEGTAVITATAKDGTKAECSVTVTKAGTGSENEGGNGGNEGGNGGNEGGNGTVQPTLTLSTYNVTLYTGKDTNSIAVVATVTGPSKDVAWVSKDPKVAKIVGNKIVAVKAGSTTVTATANNITQEVKVTVKNPGFTLKQGKKKFTKSKLTVKRKKKVVLTVSVNPSKSGISLGKLSKKEKKIATVTLKKGKLTIKGKKKGKVNVVLKSGKATKKIKVTVK